MGPTFPIQSLPPAAASSPGAPARIESGQTPNAPLQGEKVAPKVVPSVVPSVPYPASAPSLTGAPTREPAKAKETIAPTDDPQSDRHPPVLEYLRFDPPEIQDGGVTVFSVGATDDLSGVRSVFGTVRSPSGAAVVPFAAQDAAGSGVLSAKIVIPLHAETGDWFVWTLQIVDKAGNPLVLAFAKTTVPPGGAVRVFSADSDSTAPDVHGVSIDKRTVGAGERTQIVVDVDDDRSGVASVTGMFESPSKAAFIPFNCRPNGEVSWMGDVQIPANADCGEWTLRQLRVADKANNTAFLTSDSPQVGRVSFVVSGGGACDSDPPFIDAMSVSPAIVSNASPTEVILTITAHDEGSGVASLSGRYEGPVSSSGQVPRIFFACAPDPKNPDAPMTARISVPQFAAKGIWRVSLLQILDKARNTRSYNSNDPALVNASFTVE